MSDDVKIYLFDQRDDLEPLVRQKLNENFRRLQRRSTVVQEAIDDDIRQQAGESGTRDYNQLDNKPSIEGVTLVDDKTFPQLGIFIDSDDDMDGYPDSDMYALTIQDINALWNGGL